MENRVLIVHLILQDLKHHQLTLGLKKFGFEAEMYTLELLEVIASMAGLSSISDEVSNTYHYFLERSVLYPVSYHGDELRPLAEECYGELERIIGSF